MLESAIKQSIELPYLLGRHWQALELSENKQKQKQWHQF
jgi:hypothetical protein